ncbi:MAG: hypothetical protein ACOYN3_02905 [Acidimicrobiia bacterium]
MTTAAMVAAVGFSMIVLVWAMNAVVLFYVKGAVRQSLDEAVHAGVASGIGGDPIGACTARLDEALQGLLALPMRNGIAAQCSANADEVVASASVNLEGWGGVIFGGSALQYRDTVVRRAPLEFDPARRGRV